METFMKIKLLLTFTITIIAFTFAFGQGQATGYVLGVGTGADVVNQGVSCASCHSANGIATPKWDSWKETRHSFATDSGFAQSNHFGFNCLPCHTTGWNTSAITFGADEYVKLDSTATPNYTPTDINNWNRTKNVQCEACHGNLGKYDPNALNDGTQPDTLWTDYVKHFDFTGVNKLDYSAELCGTCHNGSHHGFYEEWAVSKHAQSLNAAGGLVTKTASCAKCHVAQNAAAYINGTFFTFGDGADEGKPYYDKIMVASNSPDIQPITCVVCHDPHSAKNGIQQLRIPITAQFVICDMCHNNSTLPTVPDIHTTPHQSTSGCLSGAPNFGWRYSAAELRSVGRDTVYQSSAHTFAATQRCIDCHLNADDKDIFGNVAHGHTFEPRVQACAKCHPDYYTSVDTSNHAKMFDFRRAQTVTDSLLAVLKDKLDKSTHADSLTDAFLKANYNYNACTGEGSFGIHNTKLVQKFIGEAIALYTPTATAVSNISNTLPKQYSLSQNFPNPFNPTTQIRFSIPEASNVKLTIYDAVGREVGVLVNNYLTAGTYNYSWNAGSFASGIYFYRIEAKNFVMVKKMVLLK
jgi:hypothetical protein